MKKVFPVLSLFFVIEDKKDLFLKLFAGLSIFITVISFGYNDTILINRQTMSFLGTMFDEGGYGLLRYYDYAHDVTALQRSKGLLAVDTMYDVPIFLLEAMWLWPLYLLSRIIPADVSATWYGILWGKCLFLLALLVSAELMGRIYLFEFPRKERIKWLILGYVTSIITFSSVYIVGQCDVIVICFILASILEYLKKGKLFVLYSALAIAMKPFALFPFLIMVLLREKNIYKIMMNVIIGNAMMLFCKILFSNQTEATQAARNEFFVRSVQNMLRNKIPVMYGDVPTVIFGVLICIVLAYMLHETFANLIGLCLLCFVTFFLSFISTPYWFLYVLPFLCIALEIIDNRRALLLSVAGNVFLFLSHMLRFYWVYDINIVNNALIGRLFGKVSTSETSLTLSNIFKHYNVAIPIGCLHAVFLVCVFGIIIFYVLKIKGLRLSIDEEKISTECRIWASGVQIIVAFLPLSLWLFNLLANRSG